MSDLTERQREVLEFIKSKVPSVPTSMASTRDIGKHFGIKSPNGVRCHLFRLRKLGYIEWDEKKKGIRILEPEQREPTKGLAGADHRQHETKCCSECGREKPPF